MNAEQLVVADGRTTSADRGLQPARRVFQLPSVGQFVLPTELIFKICGEVFSNLHSLSYYPSLTQRLISCRRAIYADFAWCVPH